MSEEKKREAAATPSAREREEGELVERIADRVVRRGLTAPVILFLASLEPVGFLASQGLAFFAPFVGVLFDRHDWDVLQRMLERRDGIERILRAVEKRDAEGAQPSKDKPGQDGSAEGAPDDPAGKSKASG